ncbi:MAG: hypothetical protein DRG27_05170, partial [Deltaproteobacteria bacterium]
LYLLCAYTVLLIISLRKATSSSQTKRIIWGAFGGLILWTCVGEILSNKAVPMNCLFHPFTHISLTELGIIPYLVFALLLLTFGFFGGAIKDGFAMMLMVFLTTWAPEIYFHNYSEYIPRNLISSFAYTLSFVFAIVFLLALYKAFKEDSFSKKIFWGYWIYWGLIYCLCSIFVLSHPMPAYF